MGAVVGKAANGIGSILGNVVAAPFKSVFGGSCEDVCSGPWDVICFIEHLCVSNLVKLLMSLGLCFIILMFLYLLFELGICQCIIKSLCKICWTGCKAYWFALEDITCFLWHKLKNTKRVHRRRRRHRHRHRHRHRRLQDIEEVGYSSSNESVYYLDNYDHPQLSVSRKRNRERNRHKKSSYPHHHHVKLKSSEVLVPVKGNCDCRRLEVMKVKKPQKRRRTSYLH